MREDRVVFHGNDSLYCLDVSTGEERWSVPVSTVSGPSFLFSSGEQIIVHAKSVIARDENRAPTFGNEILSISWEGELLWRRKIEGPAQHVTHTEERLWTLSEPIPGEQTLVGFDLKRGELLKPILLPFTAYGVTYIDPGFVFSVFGDRSLPPRYIRTDQDGREFTPIRVGSVKELATAEEFVDLAVSPLFREVVSDEMSAKESLAILRDVVTTDGEFFYYLREKEEIELVALGVDLVERWSVSVAEDADLVAIAGELVVVIGDYDYSLFRKENGELVGKIEEAKCLPLQCGEMLFVKCVNEFVRL